VSFRALFDLHGRLQSGQSQAFLSDWSGISALDVAAVTLTPFKLAIAPTVSF
jgi:hypothetical protein